MTTILPDQKAVLMDMAAFINYAIVTQKFSYLEIVADLAHDLRGLMGEEVFFPLKTQNYRRHLAVLPKLIVSERRIS